MNKQNPLTLRAFYDAHLAPAHPNATATLRALRRACANGTIPAESQDSPRGPVWHITNAKAALAAWETRPRRGNPNIAQLRAATLAKGAQ